MTLPPNDSSHGGDPAPHDDLGGVPGDAWGMGEESTAWSDGLSQTQLELQADLSCLVDGELDSSAAARVMVQLEESPECRSFFEDIQRFSRLHRDLSDADRLEARIAMLGADEVARAAANVDLTHRLATIFYQLGKAYALAGLDLDQFKERVFEEAVPVEQTKTRGRGFVDGVVASGKLDDSADADGRPWGGSRADWTQARHLLNGRLERIADPLEKGRRLLEQAAEIDPSHEESRIYLAFLLGTEGKALRAAELYREVFDTAISLPNRGHAAMQLGRLYFQEGDLRQAILLWRWISMVGLDREDARFAVTHLNLGHAYLTRGQQDRSLDSYRLLMDRHLDAGGEPAEVTRMFVENDDVRELFSNHEGFLGRLTTVVPELLKAS